MKLKASRAREIFDAVGFFEFGEYMKKNFGGGECVAAGAMSAGNRDREVACDRVETVIEKIRQRAS